MKKILIVLCVMYYFGGINACILKINSLRYPALTSKSDFQEQLRKQIDQSLDNPNWAPFLLKQGIIRQVRDIESTFKGSSSSFEYALREITGFPDGLVIEEVAATGQPWIKNLCISVNIQEYFKQVKTPQSNDLVVYMDDKQKIQHFGVYQGPYTICSQWNTLHNSYVITHVLLNIPRFSKKDAAIFLRLKKKYHNKNFLIKTMQADNMESMLYIFYYNYFETGKYNKKDFIRMYSAMLHKKTQIDRQRLETLMAEYNWRKPKRKIYYCPYIHDNIGTYPKTIKSWF